MSRKQDLSAFGIEDRSYSIDEWQAIEEKTGEKFSPGLTLPMSDIYRGISFESEEGRAVG